ncbi:MAG: RNA methyltransferase [Gallionellaceae bacterium]|jgi:TrmH family RNA methyltransferase
MKHISSRDNAFFKELAKLAGSSKQRRQAQQTLLDGAHLLAAYLASGAKPLHLLVNAAGLNDPEVLELLKQSGNTPITQLDQTLFKELSELKTQSGILALIALPQPRVTPGKSQFCILLEDVQDPGNVGSILRSAAAAGCDAAYLSAGCADVWSPKVLRAGMGGQFVMSIYEHVDLLTTAQQFSGKLFATALTAPESLYQANLAGSIGLVLGNEGSGLSAQLLDCVTQQIKIPMPGKVESLNVAAAAAVCLFEAARQRG